MEDDTQHRGGSGPVRGSKPAHTLEVRSRWCSIEAWGPDRAGCFAEALRALVSQYARVTDPPVSRTLPLAAGPGPAEELLASLLEEVVGTIEVFSLVPVRFHLVDAEDGGVSGDMEVVALSEAHVVGRAPRSVDRGGLTVVGNGGGWRCRVLVGL